MPERLCGCIRTLVVFNRFVLRLRFVILIARHDALTVLLFAHPFIVAGVVS